MRFYRLRRGRAGVGGNAGERVSLAAGMEDGVQRNTLLDDDLPFPHVRSLHSPREVPDQEISAVETDL